MSDDSRPRTVAQSMASKQFVAYLILFLAGWVLALTALDRVAIGTHGAFFAGAGFGIVGHKVGEWFSDWWAAEQRAVGDGGDD